jgi:pyruvate dehydrogenase E1 component beta subunit
MDTILASVRKTHKAVVVAEDCRRAGPTAEIAATISECCFEYLDAPVARVGARDTFIAHNAGMSEFAVPGSAQIEQAIREVVHWS